MYVIVWEFQAKPGLEKAFEQAYGGDGIWARFFSRSEGFLEAVLLRCHESKGRYLTIDKWDSREAYLNFRKRWSSEYETIDQQCESLTQSERKIGEYWETASSAELPPG